MSYAIDKHEYADSFARVAGAKAYQQIEKNDNDGWVRRGTVSDRDPDKEQMEAYDYAYDVAQREFDKKMAVID